MSRSNSTKFLDRNVKNRSLSFESPCDTVTEKEPRSLLLSQGENRNTGLPVSISNLERPMRERMKVPRLTSVLSYEDVSALFRRLDLRDFWRQLIDQLHEVYLDDSIDEIGRQGISKSGRRRNRFNTVEVMLCKANDYTCVKQISSYPCAKLHPTVMGTIVLTVTKCEQRPALVCDATLLTPLRTAGSTALVAQSIAGEAKTLGIVGSGLEGQAHALGLATVLSELQEVRLSDVDAEQSAKATASVKTLMKAIRRDDVRIRDLASDTSKAATADIVVTATYGLEHVLQLDWLKRNAFIAAIGSDLPDKKELSHDIFPYAKFVVDDMDQCLKEGELQHAHKTLALELEQPGRVVTVSQLLKNRELFVNRAETIIVYDGTGTARQDLAVGRVILDAWKNIRGDLDRLWSPIGKPDLTTLLGLEQEDTTHSVAATIESEEPLRTH